MNYANLHKRKMESVIRDWEVAGQRLVEELRLTSRIPTSDDRVRIVDTFNKVLTATYNVAKG